MLAQAVQDYHIALVATSNRIQEPIIQELLGIRFFDQHPHSSDLKIVGGARFVTANLPDPLTQGTCPLQTNSASRSR